MTAGWLVEGRHGGQQAGRLHMMLNQQREQLAAPEPEC